MLTRITALPVAITPSIEQARRVCTRGLDSSRIVSDSYQSTVYILLCSRVSLSSSNHCILIRITQVEQDGCRSPSFPQFEAHGCTECECILYKTDSDISELSKTFLY